MAKLDDCCLPWSTVMHAPHAGHAADVRSPTRRALALSRGLLSGALESPEGARRRELASKRKLACQKRPCAPLWRVYLASPRPGQKKHTSPHPGQKNCTSPHPGQKNYTSPHPGQKNYTSPHPGQTQPHLTSPGKLPGDDSDVGLLVQQCKEVPMS